jgi:hypothetical protein
MSTRCPSCGAILDPGGVVTLDGVEFPVFQCDTCTREVDFLGSSETVALTFALRPDGSPFDPADPDADYNVAR